MNLCGQIRAQNRVVIIDDEPLILADLEYLLMDYFSIQPILFNRVGPALEFLRTNPALIVITDINVHVESGKDVYDFIQSNGRHVDTALAVITILSHPNAIDRVGGSDFIYARKPFQPAVVKKLVFDCLRYLKKKQNILV